MLKLLSTGYAQQAQRKLKLRFQAWRRSKPSGAKPVTPRRKVADMHKLAASAAEARNKQAAINSHYLYVRKHSTSNSGS
jgi:hypothetical protein